MTEQASQQRPLVGIAFMLSAMVLFAIQDAFSKVLAAEYNPVFVTMIRYWALILFVMILSQGARGGIKRVARTNLLGWQIFRGVLLVVEVCVMVLGFVKLGLVEAHAVFAITPLLTTAFAIVFLKERSDIWQWLFVGLGFVGILIILRPGTGLFDPWALVPLCAAIGFAVYATTTRYVGQSDSGATSFFYMGIAGGAAITLAAPFVWEDMAMSDWPMMAALCVTGASSHFLLIKAYQSSDAGTLQPFAYLQGVFAAAVGVIFLGESLSLPLLIGAAVVIFSGVLCLARVRRLQRARPTP